NNRKTSNRRHSRGTWGDLSKFGRRIIVSENIAELRTLLRHEPGAPLAKPASVAKTAAEEGYVFARLDDREKRAFQTIVAELPSQIVARNKNVFVAVIESKEGRTLAGSARDDFNSLKHFRILQPCDFIFDLGESCLKSPLSRSAERAVAVDDRFQSG